MLFGKSRDSMSDEEKREMIDRFYQKSRAHFPEVPEITAGELVAERENGSDLVIVDVRAPEEQAVSMIDGAVTVADFEAMGDAARDQKVVAYCTIGHRSGLFCKSLHEKGWSVRNLKGAILSWTHAGGDLVDQSGPTKRVHVWSEKTNLIADGYESVC